VASGPTNIIASLSGINSNGFLLTVTNPTLTLIAITGPNSSITKGSSEQFIATGTYSDSSTGNITSQVTWSSSNNSVATIAATGVALGVATGSTNISASLGGVTSNSFPLTVTAPTLTSIAIAALNGSIAKGTSEQFTATGSYSDNSTANITSQVAWGSSNASVATIGAIGLATAVAVGSTSISASLSGINSNVFPLTVTAPTLTLIAITAPGPSIIKGTSEQFTATGSYSDNSTANITTQVAWGSSNTSVATIGAIGLATAVAVGSTSISASLSGINSNVFPLTVTAPTLTSIAITAPGPSIVKGASEQFTATGSYSDNSSANITSQVTWSSSNTVVGTISATGLATAVGAGSTNITGSFGGLTSNPFSLTVTQPAPLTVLSYNVLFGSQSYNAIGTTRNRLPWKITGIQVVFSQPVANGNTNSLTGVTATGLSGLGTNTLTWTVSPLTIGNFSTSLAGSGANALTGSGGIPLNSGAGFSQTLKVLLGDFNDDGVVSSTDLVGVNNMIPGPYSIFADINGDGVVNVSDVQAITAVRLNFDGAE
jgi:hypothetical protein